jgi:hypothetical protein
MMPPRNEIQDIEHAAVTSLLAEALVALFIIGLLALRFGGAA